MKSKKADLSEGVTLIIILFFLAVSFIVVGLVNSKIRDIVKTTPLNQSDASGSIISGLDWVSTRAINNAYMFLFVGMIIGTLLSSFLTRVHPAFLFLYIIFAGVTVFLAILLANAYNTIIENDTISSMVGDYPAITWVMANSIKIMVGVLIVSMIILFAKPPADNII